MGMISSGRYAAVTSTLALVIALGGTSYAAVKITGADIKDNTVTTKDVKDKTLKVKDLSPGARKKLKGATGPAGPTGPSGPSGPAGPPGAPGVDGDIGPSNVFTVYNNNGTQGNITFKNLLTLTLQPGSYAAFGKTWAHRQATGSVQYQNCRLLLGAVIIDSSGGDLPDVSSSYNTVVTTASFTITTPTTLTLACMSTNNAFIDFKKLTAIKVGTVSNVAGPNVGFVDDLTDLR